MATRHLIWFSAMAGVVLLPVLSISLPGWHVLPAWLDVNAREAPRLLPTTGVLIASEPIDVTTAPIGHVLLPNPVETVDPDQETQQGQHSEPVTEAVATSAAAGVEVTQPETPDTSTVVLPDHPEQAASATAIAAETPVEASNVLANWIFRIWLAGCTLALLRLLLGYLSLWRLSRNSRTLTGTQANEFALDLSADLGLRRPVRLLESPQRTVPMTWGLLRPRILLPQARADWPEERLRVVLLHELGHVKRVDYLTQLVTSVACAVYWFNPLLWLAARQMQLERERACDDLVLQHGCKASDYAEHILQICEAAESPSLIRPAAVAMAEPSELVVRMCAILDETRSRRGVSHTGMLLSLLLVICLIVPIAMMRADDGNRLTNPAALGADGKQVITHTLFIWGQPKQPVFALEDRVYESLPPLMNRIEELMVSHEPFPYFLVRVNPPAAAAQPLVHEFAEDCREIGFINVDFAYDLVQPPPQLAEREPANRLAQAAAEAEPKVAREQPAASTGPYLYILGSGVKTPGVHRVQPDRITLGDVLKLAGADPKKLAEAGRVVRLMSMSAADGSGSVGHSEDLIAALRRHAPFIDEKLKRFASGGSQKETHIILWIGSKDEWTAFGREKGEYDRAVKIKSPAPNSHWPTKYDALMQTAIAQQKGRTGVSDAAVQTVEHEKIAKQFITDFIKAVHAADERAVEKMLAANMR